MIRGWTVFSLRFPENFRALTVHLFISCPCKSIHFFKELSKWKWSPLSLNLLILFQLQHVLYRSQNRCGSIIGRDVAFLQLIKKISVVERPLKVHLWSMQEACVMPVSLCAPVACNPRNLPKRKSNCPCRCSWMRFGLMSNHHVMKLKWCFDILHLKSTAFKYWFVFFRVKWI